MHHSSVRRARVNHAAAARNNADMSRDDDDITRLQVREVIDSLAAPGARPAAGSHIGLAHTGVIQAPVDKTGAVKSTVSLGTPDIGRAEFGTRDA